MNELENLKEIGIKEISRKTHIEPTFLQYIFDKNFEKLSRLNMRGYAKILQREYGVDLSELLAEYDAFMQENMPDESKKTKVSPKFLLTHLRMSRSKGKVAVAGLDFSSGSSF